MIRPVIRVAIATNPGEFTAGGSGSVANGSTPAPKKGAARMSRRRRTRDSSPVRPPGGSRRDLPTLEARKAPGRAAVLIPHAQSARGRLAAIPHLGDAPPFPLVLVRRRWRRLVLVRRRGRGRRGRRPGRRR